MPKLTIPTDENGLPTAVFLDGHVLPSVERVVIEATTNSVVNAHIKVTNVEVEDLQIAGPKLVVRVGEVVYSCKAEQLPLFPEKQLESYN